MGRTPCVARPAANVVAWASAIPTSKKRSGHFFWKMLVPVPEGIAAVIVTKFAPYDPVTGKLRPVNPGPPQWTKVFGEALTQLAAYLGPLRRTGIDGAELAGDGVVGRA